MLITTKDELLQYDKLMSNFDVDKLTPFIEAAELKFIQPFIGKEQYADLNTAYQNSIKEVAPTPLDQEDIDLLHYVRRALTQLALGLGGSTLAVNVNQHGITRSEDGGRKSAYQYQEVNWKNDKFKLGFTFLEDLHSFLEDNLGDYTLYAESEERTFRMSLFVNGAKAMRDQMSIAIDEWVFLQLIPLVVRVERQVKNILGADDFAALKTAVLNDSVAAEDELKVDLIRTAVANLALGKGITQLRLKVDGSGVSMIMNENTRDLNMKNPVSDALSNELMKDLLADGNAALVGLEDLVTVVVEDGESVSTVPGAVDGGFIC